MDERKLICLLGYGLSSTELSDLCYAMSIPSSGRKDEKIERILSETSDWDELVNYLTLENLRFSCDMYGLEKKGNKADLAQRLYTFLEKTPLKFLEDPSEWDADSQEDSDEDDEDEEDGEASSKTRGAPFDVHRRAACKDDHVFIIHGRNTEVLRELRTWLNSLGLFAKGFDEHRSELGGSPTIMQVIRKGLGESRAVIALITPDELAFLRPELHREHDSSSDRQRWQARPNVLFEAGMAFALAGEERTLILVAGCAELFSDIGGLHYHRIPQDATGRELLKKTLATMGCRIRDTPHHHSEGNFVAGPLHRLEMRWPFV